MMVLLAVLTLQQADLVVTNAQIYTSDVNRPVAEALAVRAGRIAFDRSNRGALALACPRTTQRDRLRETASAEIVDASPSALALGQALRNTALLSSRANRDDRA